ncbi:MAG: GIY-YIG nuclease family protein [Hyphomonadaceae bacterium]|nr:GIY-YIG nuclease family protein [Hyphomonadaceae bacterium]
MRPPIAFAAAPTPPKAIGMQSRGAFCYVYVLGCPTPRGLVTYVGWTTDLERRLAEHNAGTGAKTTRGRAWTLLYAERYPTPREAMQREWRLKRDRAFRARLRG